MDSLMANPDTKLSHEELTSYQDAFSAFDTNGDSKISLSELGTVMRSLGRTPTDDEIQQIVAKVDSDRNGFIEFDEFVELMTSDSFNAATDGMHDELYQAFISFDQNGNGKITKSELGAVMNALGERLTEEELQQMIREADLDGDNEIDFTEFKKMLTTMK